MHRLRYLYVSLLQEDAAGERKTEVTRVWRPPQDVFIFFGRGSSFFGTAINKTSRESKPISPLPPWPYPTLRTPFVHLLGGFPYLATSV
jgi:hypothetical protein